MAMSSWAFRGLALFFYLFSFAIASPPYNPTRALATTIDNGRLVYVFIATGIESSSFILAALNTTSLKASSLPYSLITPQLPFVTNGKTQAFVMAMNQNQEIVVVSGACSSGSASQIWTFTPSNTTTDGSGSWGQQTIGQRTGDSGGVNFGATAMYSSKKGSPGASGMYVFGGLCPYNDGSSQWQSQSRYPGSMIEFVPQSLSPTSQLPNNTYTISTVATTGSPVPEAGYSATKLNSSIAKDNSQDNFLIIGGNTQGAFINMSNLAIWSAPKQAWSYVGVDPPLNSTGAPILNLERSGHSALLSEDGRTLTIFGGWVGDITQAATPQMLVLNIGDAYGGAGRWSWTVPKSTGPAPQASDGGVWGHDAVLLPGNVMLVVGGYSIPASSGTSKRADATLNNKSYLYNLTSATWMSEYHSPITAPSTGTNPNPPTTTIIGTNNGSNIGSGLNVSSAKHVVVVVAAILSSIVVLCILFFVGKFLWRRRQKQKLREDTLRNISLGAQRFNASVMALAPPGIDGRGGALDAMSTKHSSTTMSTRESWGNDSARGDGLTEAERTGLLVEVPSPTRGLRRSVGGRGYDRLSMGSAAERPFSINGGIHPIDERDEYETAQPVYTSVGSLPNIVVRPDIHSNAGSIAVDPFADPPRTSTFGSEISGPHERSMEFDKWVEDWAAADAMMGRGRHSPDKESFNSMKSDLSSVSKSTGSGGARPTLSRNISQNSNYPTIPHSGYTGPGPSLDVGRANSPTKTRTGLHHRPVSNSSVATSKQTEVETFLDRSDSVNNTSPPGSPSKRKLRSTGWFPAMRKAFPFGLMADRNSAYEAAPSSSKVDGPEMTDKGQLFRRATTGTMWSRKQGAADWDVHDADPDVNGDEWDVEAAVQNRVVQLMFSVPKERLRVVNADYEESIDEEEDITAALDDRVSSQTTFTTAKEGADGEIDVDMDLPPSLHADLDAELEAERQLRRKGKQPDLSY